MLGEYRANRPGCTDPERSSVQVAAHPGLPLQAPRPDWKSSVRLTVALAWIAAAQEAPPADDGIWNMKLGLRYSVVAITGTIRAIPRASAGACRQNRSVLTHRLSADCGLFLESSTGVEHA